MGTHICLGLAVAVSLASPCLAGPIPDEIRGRWSDADCGPEAHVLTLTADRLDISQDGKSAATAVVDAQGKVATGLRLRFTRILHQMSPGGAHVGDSFVLRLDDGKLVFVERVINGRKLPGPNETVSRCPS